jgi:hypothetical protein
MCLGHGNRRHLFSVLTKCLCKGLVRPQMEFKASARFVPLQHLCESCHGKGRGHVVSARFVRRCSSYARTVHTHFGQKRDDLQPQLVMHRCPRLPKQGRFPTVSHSVHLGFAGTVRMAPAAALHKVEIATKRTCCHLITRCPSAVMLAHSVAAAAAAAVAAVSASAALLLPDAC